MDQDQLAVEMISDLMRARDMGSPCPPYLGKPDMQQ